MPLTGKRMYNKKEEKGVMVKMWNKVDLYSGKGNGLVKDMLLLALITKEVIAI